jgi:hypothetical protein
MAALSRVDDWVQVDGIMTSDQIGSILLAIAGVYSIIKSFRGRDFFRAGIGGISRKPIPKLIARPLVFLTGLALLALATVGLWRHP